MPATMTADAAAELQGILAQVHAHSVADTRGEVATYIPELARANPDDFGLALATVSGQLFTVGEAGTPFTIQSVSKAFTYCLANELLGPEEVMRHVGVEPSGDAFNSIEFDPTTARPFNPMVNAGAITVAGLLYRQFGAEAFDAVLDRFSRAAGRRLDMDEAVYSSEAETGHRNRAIGHLLKGTGVIDGPVEDIVDLYFRQCAIRVTATDLAWMSATLANLGTQPCSNEPVFDLMAVRDTQSVMYSCGMYNYSGNWGFRVGIPAKSGVGGGLVGVVNRQLGVAAYSPRLDAKGNTVRGVAAFELLAEELGLHAFCCTKLGSSIVERFLR
jgi:glutaminase